MIQACIKELVAGRHLGRQRAGELMQALMSGRATDAQVGALLTALRIKGETAEEIAGCAEAMRRKALRIQAPAGVIDTCGTGGDASGTFNISTAAALVAAAAGARVAKHGNRSVSSASGSADVLRELGVEIDAGVEVVERCIREVGIGFLFAPRLHTAMKHVAGPRRELGMRTIFNLLGPLTNPAAARRQVLGVYDRELAPLLARVLKLLGSERALVVHGFDGLDEISIADRTAVAELRAGEVSEYTLAPEDFGMRRSPLETLRVPDPAASAALIREVLAGARGPARDIVLLNAAGALLVAGLSPDLAQGLALAGQAIDTGKAADTLKRLAAVSRS